MPACLGTDRSHYKLVLDVAQCYMYVNECVCSQADKQCLIVELYKYCA